MTVEVTVLSLGAGVQSTALAIMLDREELAGFKRPRWAIFADTGAEPPHVYETLDWLAERISYPVVRTSWGNLAENTWKAIRGEEVAERGHTGKATGYIDLPVFTETGMARRQCTGVYKIRPVRAKIRELAGAKPPQLKATQYLGISLNETRRATPADVKWLTNVYPLIEHGLNRQDCVHYLDANFQGHPVRRSACYFCPYRNRNDWTEMREMYPDLYQDAIEMERAMATHPRGPWMLRAGGLEQMMARNDDEAAPQMRLEGF